MKLLRIFIIINIFLNIIYSDNKLFVTAQGFDQVNILTIVNGIIQDDQEIISVNFMEDMLDTPHFVEIDKVNKYWFVTILLSDID